MEGKSDNKMIKLYPKQQEEVDRASPNWFYRMKMGSGKTVVAIAHYKKFFEGHKVLVVAPKAVQLSGSWEETFEAMSVDKTLVKVIRTDDVKKVELSSVKNAFIIVDEAHKFKNMSSQRTKALLKILKYADGFIMLSGTPIDSKLDDLESYALAFQHVKTHKEFKENYMVQKTLPYRPFPFYEVGKNKDKLVSWWQSVTSNVVTLNDIAELPEVIENNIELKRSSEYRKSLSSYKKDDKMIFESPVERHWWQRQNQNTKAKLDWLKDISEEYEQDGMIIFYNTSSELEAIKTLFKDVGEINGQKHVNHNKGVLLVQIQAGGAGLTLNEYQHAIWYSLPYGFIDFDQSKYRNYRINQTKKVTRDYLIVNGTIDDKILEALNHKKDFNASLES